MLGAIDITGSIDVNTLVVRAGINGYLRRMTLDERIRHAAKLRGVSGRELARRAGLEDTQVNALPSRLKKRPDMDVSADILAKIADAAEVSFAWLAREEGSVESSANDDAQPEAPAPVGAGSASTP